MCGTRKGKDAMSDPTLIFWIGFLVGTVTGGLIGIASVLIAVIYS